MRTDRSSKFEARSSKLEKILLVRNDNIGDLICSIPAIQLIRTHFPKAEIALLVNSYNAPIVEPLFPKWVDRLMIYRKTKHVGFSISQLFHFIQFYSQLRLAKYDAVILLVGGHSRQTQSFAKWSGTARIVGYGPNNEGPTYQDGLHELEYSWHLATYLCNTKVSLPSEIDYPIRRKGIRIGIQITSRKPGNRWDAKRFAELAKKIYERSKEKSLLIWSPGDETTPTHPGDDQKARDILNLARKNVEPRPCKTLKELISILQECQVLITPDGGAMHLAAAMGIDIVAMFGQSDPIRWRPWTPRARVLQSPTRTIQDIDVEKVFQAWMGLAENY